MRPHFLDTPHPAGAPSTLAFFRPRLGHALPFLLHTLYPERSSLPLAQPLLATVQLPAETAFPHQVPRHPGSLRCLDTCCVSTLYFPFTELTTLQLNNCVTGRLVAVFLLKCKSLKSGDSGCPTTVSSVPRAGWCSQMMPRNTLLNQVAEPQGVGIATGLLQVNSLP